MHKDQILNSESFIALGSVENEAPIGLSARVLIVIHPLLQDILVPSYQQYKQCAQFHNMYSAYALILEQLHFIFPEQCISERNCY